MILLFRFVCSVILLQGLYALNLTEIDVPAIVFIEKEEIDPIKLDCKYELDGEPTEFIVKWWKDDELIYQWIYGQEPAAIANPRKRRQRWSERDDADLIEVWAEFENELRKAKRNSHIFAQMAQKLGSNFTAQEVHSKVKNLSARYRSETKLIGPSGGSPSSWVHYQRVHQIIGSHLANSHIPTESFHFHPFEDDVKKYEVSTDPFQQYRGVILTNPNLNTTGSYKCVVRSYEGKDFDEKSLVKKLQVVHTASHSLNLYHRRIENETQVECTINDVYPKPSIDLKSDDGDPVQIISTNFIEDNGLFNATMVAVVADDDEDPDSYICTVMLPGLNLTRTEKSGSGLRKLEPGVWMILFILLRVH